MKRTYELKKVPIWPVTKIAFLVFLVIGILFALIYSIILSGVSFLASNLLSSDVGGGFGPIQSFGIIMVPIMAISYAIFGTIGTIIWALLYNFVAGLIGGLELELESKDKGAATEEVSGRVGGKETHVPEGPINGF